MKLIYQIGILCCIIIPFIQSCEEMEDTYREFYEKGETVYIAKADSINTFNGNNRVKLTWLLLSDPKVDSYKVFWNSRRDSVTGQVTKTLEIDTVSVFINNLNEGIHHFEIFMYDKFGNSSVKANAIGRAYGDDYKSSLLQRPYKSIKKKNDDIIFEWLEPEVTVVGVYFEYKNNIDELITQIVANSASLDTLKSVMAGSEIRYRTGFLPEPSALDTFYTDFDVINVADF